MIPVFFSKKQIVLDDLGASPSARKPIDVLASWKEQGFPIQIQGPNPATVEDFNRAHDPAFVQGVLAGTRVNGFGTKHMTVAESLPWTSGSMLSAARHVLKKGVPVAVSPTSGFHHASYQKADGFCTFNGLMVTVLALRSDGVTGRIGILDLDEHYGNGTDDILRKVGETGVEHYTFGGDNIPHQGGDVWLKRLPAIVQRFRGCDIVLFQAGADPHRDDPFSRGILTTEQLYKRDQIVFQGLHALQVPVVWNLAGGYQTPLRKVLDIHDNTMRACTEVYAEHFASLPNNLVQIT